MYVAIVLISLLLLIALLTWGRIERQWIGLAIALLLVVSGAVTLEEAAGYIDWDVLGLILGISVYTIYLERSGFAQLVAYYILKHTGHSLYTLVVTLSLSAGLVSVFIENVSVVLLFHPVVFTLSRALGIEPTLPMIFVALSSNIAGSATMVGDPPAIITAGAFRLSFTDFIVYRGKPSMFFFTIASMILAISITCRLSLKSMASVESFSSGFEVLGRERIDRLFFVETISLLAVKIALLSLRSIIPVPLSLSAAIAVGGVTLARLIHRDVESVKRAFKQGFEWRLLLFLASVFTLSGAIEKHGIARMFGEYIVSSVGGDVIKVTSAIILLCTLLSSVIDNVPITLSMIPIVRTASAILNYDPVVIMWAALIGITLGGNLTYIGASANVTAVRILEKNSHTITFLEFIKISIVYNTVSLSSAWLLYTLTYL